MGEYTDIFKFYKPDRSESVNVDLHLNGNLNIVDSEMRSIMEYVTADVNSINDSTLPKKYGYKWFKPYNNGIWYWGSSNGTDQTINDAVSFVPAWLDFTSFFSAGYTGVGERKGSAWPYINLVHRGNYTDIKFTGNMVAVDGSELPLNTETTLFNLPAQYRPPTDRCFTTFAGKPSDAGGFSITRFTASAATGNYSFYRMGSNTASPADRIISLSGIRFSTDMVA